VSASEKLATTAAGGNFTPTALASSDNGRRYDFRDVRVATLTLLTLTALSG
jgi:hypothetical protein